MSERADLDRSRFVLDGDPYDDAEALTALLPDVDWEALRDAASQLGRHSIDTTADGSQVHVPPARLRRGGWSTIENTLWGLLAVYDGKDG